MPGVLLDLRTGDPILSEEGDYVQVDNNYAFYQIINNLLNCQVESEIWNKYYGFDLQEAVRMNSEGAPGQVIESLLAQALSSQKERLIFMVDYIHAERDGQQMKVKFSVQSRLGTIVTAEQILGESVESL